MSRACICVEQTYNTRSNFNITIYYLFNPPVSHSSPSREKPCTISHRESVLYCSTTDGSTPSSCLGHSATIRTSTPSHFSCYHTCECLFIYTHMHACVHTHTQTQSLSWTHWHEMTGLAVLLLIFFWQLVANVTFVGFIFYCWGIFCVAIEPSCQVKRESTPWLFTSWSIASE